MRHRARHDTPFEGPSREPVDDRETSFYGDPSSLAQSEASRFAAKPVALLVTIAALAASPGWAEPAAPAPDALPVRAALPIPSAPDAPAALPAETADMESARRAAPEPSASLEQLLALPSVSARPPAWSSPDASIAAAVEAGPRPDLEPRKPFRKRDLDLFQTERPVEIGHSEMLLRLRLRARSRETMSVELRF